MPNDVNEIKLEDLRADPQIWMRLSKPKGSGGALGNVFKRKENPFDKNGEAAMAQIQSLAAEGKLYVREFGRSRHFRKVELDGDKLKLGDVAEKKAYYNSNFVEGALMWMSHRYLKWIGLNWVAKQIDKRMQRRREIVKRDEQYKEEFKSLSKDQQKKMKQLRKQEKLEEKALKKLEKLQKELEKAQQQLDQIRGKGESNTKNEINKQTPKGKEEKDNSNPTTPVQQQPTVQNQIPTVSPEQLQQPQQTTQQPPQQEQNKPSVPQNANGDLRLFIGGKEYTRENIHTAPKEVQDVLKVLDQLAAQMDAGKTTQQEQPQNPTNEVPENNPFFDLDSFPLAQNTEELPLVDLTAPQNQQTVPQENTQQENHEIPTQTQENADPQQQDTTETQYEDINAEVPHEPEANNQPVATNNEVPQQQDTTETQYEDINAEVPHEHEANNQPVAINNEVPQPQDTTETQYEDINVEVPHEHEPEANNQPAATNNEVPQPQGTADPLHEDINAVVPPETVNEDVAPDMEQNTTEMPAVEADTLTTQQPANTEDTLQVDQNNTVQAQNSTQAPVEDINAPLNEPTVLNEDQVSAQPIAQQDLSPLQKKLAEEMQTLEEAKNWKEPMAKTLFSHNEGSAMMERYQANKIDGGREFLSGAICGILTNEETTVEKKQQVLDALLSGKPLGSENADLISKGVKSFDDALSQCKAGHGQPLANMIAETMRVLSWKASQETTLSSRLVMLGKTLGNVAQTAGENELELPLREDELADARGAVTLAEVSQKYLEARQYLGANPTDIQTLEGRVSTRDLLMGNAVEKMIQRDKRLGQSVTNTQKLMGNGLWSTKNLQTYVNGSATRRCITQEDVQNLLEKPNSIKALDLCKSTVKEVAIASKESFNHTGKDLQKTAEEQLEQNAMNMQ